VLEVPGVVLVELDDCEDCEPHFEAEALSGEVLDGVEDALEELLVCGLLLADESGVEVLPAAPVVLDVLEVEPAMLPVWELAEVSGVLEVLDGVLDALDCELMSEELVGEAALALFGLALLGLVEELFGEVVLFGDDVLGELDVLLGELEVLLWLEVDEPALPEMLPAVFWSELDGVAEAEPLPLAAALLAIVRSLSLTFFTPETDFASFLASFLSSLLATEPLKLAVPLLTEICTPCSAGLLANCW